MGKVSIRVLVVDDHNAWRSFYSTALQKKPELQLIGQVSDGLEAVQKAQELQPDLILLDIGLPNLNGIEAARKIRELSSTSKILFLSENRSVDVVEKALNTGAGGYVVKSDAGSELFSAVEAVLQGKRFVSASLVAYDLVERTEVRGGNLEREKLVIPFRAPKTIRHEVEFYADDRGFVNGFARFIEAAFKEENPVIIVASEPHQASLRQRLGADGFNVAAEIEQGRYIPLNVTDMLANFMVNDSPDPVLFGKLAGDLIRQAAKGAKGEHPHVAVCGEGTHTLSAAGNLEAAITLEHMCNELAQHYEVDILCGYFQNVFRNEESISTLERVCAEHTVAHGRELCY